MSTARTRANRQRSRRAHRAGWIAVLGVGVAVIVGLAVFGLGRVTADGDRDTATRVAYDTSTRSLTFTLPTFTGGTVSSAQFAGKPVVLNFYASWCEVCDTEMPQFEAVYLRIHGRIGFLGVNPQQGGSDTDAPSAALARGLH